VASTGKSIGPSCDSSSSKRGACRIAHGHGRSDRRQAASRSICTPSSSQQLRGVPHCTSTSGASARLREGPRGPRARRRAHRRSLARAARQRRAAGPRRQRPRRRSGAGPQRAGRAAEPRRWRRPQPGRQRVAGRGRGRPGRGALCWRAAGPGRGWRAQLGHAGGGGGATRDRARQRPAHRARVLCRLVRGVPRAGARDVRGAPARPRHPPPPCTPRSLCRPPRSRTTARPGAAACPIMHCCAATKVQDYADMLPS